MAKLGAPLSNCCGSKCLLASPHCTKVSQLVHPQLRHRSEMIQIVKFSLVYLDSSRIVSTTRSNVLRNSRKVIVARRKGPLLRFAIKINAVFTDQLRKYSNPSRGWRLIKLAACSSPMIFSVRGSHLMTRPNRAAIAARWQVFITCKWL